MSDKVISYGRSVNTIAEQLFGTDDSLSEEEKIKKAQKVYDSVMNAFPELRNFMIAAQREVIKRGYTETILGRRRHIPDMQLPPYEFVPMKGYVNPDVDPLDPETMTTKDVIPQRIIDELTREFSGYKYFGQVVRRTKELYEEKIKVINNQKKITEASRKVVNSIIQGSAADMTKIGMLKLENHPEWKAIGGRLILPVHDELIVEVPIEHREAGERLLSQCMEEAGSFLPFPIHCDVTTTYRWYGEECPCKYPQPSSWDTVEPEEVKWIQYHLRETEVVLPTYPGPDGSKPIGDAAHGINGVISEEYNHAIFDYINRYRISPEEFIEHIKNKVNGGNNNGSVHM